MMRRERPTTDAPFLRHAACAARLDMRFAYAACRAACGCDFACVFVCGMPCACTRVRSPVCDAPRCGRAAAKRLVPRSASCPLPGCCSVRRGCGRRGVRCDFACVFVCGMPCACTRVRSPVCDAPRCGRAAAKRLVPRSASCPLPDAARCGGDTAAEAGFGGCGVRRGTLFARLAGGAAVPANGGGEDGGVPCNVRESALRIGIRLLGPEENAARAGAGICGIGTHAGIRL